MLIPVAAVAAGFAVADVVAVVAATVAVVAAVVAAAVAATVALQPLQLTVQTMRLHWAGTLCLPVETAVRPFHSTLLSIRTHLNTSYSHRHQPDTTH